MGWWPLDLETGNIKWGKTPPHDMMWGDAVADAMDRIMENALEEAMVQCKAIFESLEGEPVMTPLEFLSGIAFSLNAVEEYAFSPAFKEALGGYTLQVKLVKKEDE